MSDALKSCYTSDSLYAVLESTDPLINVPFTVCKMTKQKRTWTKNETEQLYAGLDNVARTAFRSYELSLPQIQEPIKKPLGRKARLTKSQVQTKLRELASGLKVTAIDLVRDWDQYRDEIVGETKSKPNRRSSQPARNKDAKSPEQSSANTSPSQAAQDIAKSLPPQVSSDEPAEEADIESGDPLEDNAGGEEGEDDSDDIWPATMFPPSENEIAMINAWRGFRSRNCYTARAPERETEHTFARILDHIKKGVDSFCEAQSVAHLSTTNMTRGVLELARMLLPVYTREDVEQGMKALFGDAALDLSLILRAFAAAAVTVGSLPSFPEPRIGSHVGAARCCIDSMLTRYSRNGHLSCSPRLLN